MKATPVRMRPRHAQRRLRDLLSTNWRAVAEAILTMTGLTFATWLALPAMQAFWIFALTRMTAVLDAENLVAASVPAFQGQWERLQVPTLHYVFSAPGHHDWLINFGGAIVIFLLAGLTPTLLKIPLRVLSVLHVFCIAIAGLGLQPAANVASHMTSLGTLTLCLILLMPLLLALAHSIIETRAPYRALVCALISGYLVLSLPFKLIGHMIVLDLLGPLAMPTLYLLFGPALDLLAAVAIYAWAVSWRQKAA